MKTVTILILGVLTLSRPSATASTLQFGDQDLLGMGSYASDPTAGATLEGLAPGQVTVASLRTGHTWPFSPSPEDFPGTDQIYIGSMQTRSGDGYSRAAELVRGPQVLVLDYSSLIPSGQAVETLTLGIAPDDFQMPQFGNPYIATVNGIDDVAITAHLNSIHLWTSVEFFTIGIDPSVLNRGHILTISIDQIEQPSPDGRGGDGWAIDFLTVGVTTQKIWHVDDDAQLGGDGATWSTAFKYLQDALAAASTGDEIHVAAGVYTPDRDEAGTVTPGNREATFQLINGVELRGGYARLANPDNPEEPDAGLHRTVLTGDLYGNDGPGFAHNEENSLHVVTGSGTNESAVLAGFTITAGNGNAACPNCVGGGLFNSGGSPTVLNCVFTGNTAESGGGMANWHSSSPTVADCAFTDNEGLLFAGGMDSFDGSDPTVTNSTFNGNSADQGGAVVISAGSKPTLDSCTFNGNSANRGGAVYIVSSRSATFTNCVFRRNAAIIAGGGMYSSDSSPTLTNCIFSENSAGHWGAGMDNNASNPIVTRCAFEANAVNGLGDFDGGGGMFNHPGSSPTVTGCRFRLNTAIFWGGAVVNSQNDPVFTDCVFEGNEVTGTNSWGGAMANSTTTATVINCMFAGNRSNVRGGGMASLFGANPTVINCVFSGNMAVDGGAILNRDVSSPTIINSTFNGNTATSLGGAMFVFDASIPTVNNCILWGNHPESFGGGGIPIVSFSDVEGGAVGGGNIDADPLFADPSGPDGVLGTSDDNLHLSPGSPCINVGDTTALPPDTVDLDSDGDSVEPLSCDLAGHARLLCNIVDMGAHEFGIGDDECDQDVDLVDFRRLHLLECMAGPAVPFASICNVFDFDCNGYGDLKDLAGFQRVFTGP